MSLAVIHCGQHLSISSVGQHKIVLYTDIGEDTCTSSFVFKRLCLYNAIVHGIGLDRVEKNFVPYLVVDMILIREDDEASLGSYLSSMTHRHS